MRCFPMMLACLSLAITPFLLPRTAAADDYPIVFESAQEARKIGFVIQGYGPGGDRVRPERINCYDYGTIFKITVSRAVLRAFQRRGFTLQSFCFGLDALGRFDPETGARLPTFVNMDRNAAEEVLASSPDAIAADDPLDGNFATPEIPLSLPTCYARGLPLFDCQWRFNPNTGEELSGDVAAQLTELGRQIDQIMRAKIEAGIVPTATARPGPLIAMHDDVFPVINLSEGSWAPGVHDITSPMQFDLSEGFQQRYGYALKTIGGPPSIAAKVVKNALENGRPASQIRLTAIRAMIGN